MTSSPENKITRSDLVKSAVNTGALGMEFSWTYYKQMNIAFCLMVANMLKKIYAGRPDDYAEALHRHCAFFNITVQFAPFVGGIAMAMEEKVARGEIEPERTGLMQKIMTCVGIVGVMVVGAMCQDMFWVSIPVAIGSGEDAQTLQDILDGIMPGMLGMIAFWLYYWLLSKKINPMALIVATMVVGIVGAFFGVLA